MKIKKMRNRLILFIIFFALIFIIFGVLLFIPKDYEYKYVLNNINITEKYDKKSKVYYFIFENDEVYFEYSLAGKYYKKRGLINLIENNDNCLYVKSNKLNDFNVCKDNSGYITSFYNDKINANEKEKYNNITIYDLLDRKFFIWNYTSFLSINNTKKSEISLFENDIYNLDLITKIKGYLLVADYSQKYNFTKFYLINSKNNKVKEVNLDKKIYLNSYILGTYKNYVYLYDLESKLEYKINPFKSTINKNNYELLINGKWEKTSVNKLEKMDQKFINNEIFNFELNNNILYYNTANIKIRVSNINVDRIIDSNNKECFFISGDSLYYVNIDSGIKKLMSYSEWNFNNKNIYIF